MIYKLQEEMGCRNRAEEESVSIGDALLFTTMCIIGLPVDVHIKDGSIYTGIFHTVCVEDDYAIVLKRARMTKKGNRGANVANGGVIETLIGVLLPPNGFTGSAAQDDVGDSIEFAERGEKITNSSKSDASRKHASQTRCSSRTGNGFPNGFTPTTASQSGNALEVENGDGIVLAKVASGIKISFCISLAFIFNYSDLFSPSSQKEEAPSFPITAGQVGENERRGKQGDYEKKSKFQRDLTMHESQGPSPSFNACDTQLECVESVCPKTTSKVLPNGVACDTPAPSVIKLNGQYHERSPSEDISRSISITTGVSSAVSSEVDVTSESSTTLTEMAPPKSSSSKRTAKEFKLNPGAKTFSPSFVNQRSATPPAVPTATSVSYVPDNCSVVSVATGHPEVEMSSFPPRSSLPVKYVPHGTLIAGNGGSDMQYSQPVKWWHLCAYTPSMIQIVGHMGNRAQPTRYAGQYHTPVQPGPTYVHPNSQNVMVGRLGPLVYVHPVSHGATAFSQVSTCPLLTPHPHQVHLPKHQGNAAAQALQLCVTPPFIASGQQPFTVPSHIPISQQAFPLIRPIQMPGTNGFLGSKFS
ncbi:hypothetical protein LguiA_023288 [Lonicera macranthoides]